NNNNPAKENHHDNQSSLIQKIVQESNEQSNKSPLLKNAIPKRIVQFWDDHARIPDDVNACINTWRETQNQGIELLLFDKMQASDFIFDKLGRKYQQAFERCYHPAMRSDLFRLCYIFVEGGCYIDADDAYTGSQIVHLFEDERLKIQPLCYDVGSHSMVPPAIFTKPGTNNKNWIFYFNNNPLIAGKQHFLIEKALNRAVDALMEGCMNSFPEIQSTTGPGNLTQCIFEAISEAIDVANAMLVLPEWENTAISVWPLSYHNDTRNWRLSNSQEYKA
ncbi:MAG TPA: glycosyltransferase, partial [Candidatus Babeliaceae bacterium]|nr:glycosyltransferase [Candidatus Babeliaceae bacterium]